MWGCGSRLGKPFAPILPPLGLSVAAAGARLLGIRVPEEVRQQLRYGRGLDNRKLKATGYRFGLTTRETVLRFGEALRVAHLRQGGGAPYRYEREVEEFL